MVRIWQKLHQNTTCHYFCFHGTLLYLIAAEILSSVQNIQKPKPPPASLAVCHCLKQMAVEHPRTLDVQMKAAVLGLSAWNGHGTVTGKLKNGRHLKSPCSEICSRCEIPKLTEDERNKIFDNFWSLDIHERQWMFLLGSMKAQPLKKKCALPGSKKEKHMSRTYHFLINGTRKRVCKTMFKNTLCISDSWINSALSHFSASGLIPDMRGRHIRKKSKENYSVATFCHCQK